MPEGKTFPPQAATSFYRKHFHGSRNLPLSMKSGAYAQVAAFRGTSFLFLLKGATKGRFCPIRRKKAYSKLGMSRLAESGCAKGQRRAVAGMARKVRRGLAVARATYRGIAQTSDETPNIACGMQYLDLGRYDYGAF